jgi:sterol desaturase/sphingolipid hydroxylase (fatty acid hydroxylase superfamily)
MGAPVSANNVVYASRFAILPTLFVVFLAVRISFKGLALDHWLPNWDALPIIGTLIILERLYVYKHATSQGALLARDISSTFVNLFVTGAVTGFVVLPILVFFTQLYFGRKLVFASSGQLGPLWAQIVAIVLLVSLFRYWMHRLQHSNKFLWKLHSYHHRVTDIRASNIFVSNPIDYMLRNVLIILVLGIVGFNPLALLIAIPAVQIYGFFSHCGGDLKGGWLNYLFVTPEVHRWHHTAEVPEGYGYSVNYGVEFSFWDVLFGTYYLPQKDGQTIPARVGCPCGLADESNYLRLLLVPLGLYGIVFWLRRVVRMPTVP